MADFDFNLLGDLLENAPSVGFGPQVNFGKCFVEIVATGWDEASRKFNTRPYTGNEKLASNEHIQLTFKMDLSEFNSALTREWKRRVDARSSAVKSNGQKDPKKLTDWSEIVLPSLKAVLGADYLKKLTKGVYVEVEDAETVMLDKEGNLRSFTTKPEDGSEGKTYVNTAPRFVRVFKSKAECAAAREERFKKRSDDIETEESSVPAEYVNQFKGLVDSLGLEQAVAIVDASKPFGAVTGAEVAAAAGYPKDVPPF
jgi:hypothetical protein